MANSRRRRASFRHGWGLGRRSLLELGAVPTPCQRGLAPPRLPLPAWLGATRHPPYQGGLATWVADGGWLERAEREGGLEEEGDLDIDRQIFG